jgi:hypothetical protein
MIIHFILAALILLPATFASAGSLQIAQETQTKSNAEMTGQDEAMPADLKQIQSFGIQMDDVWKVESSSKDEATALIVNPFSVRKRGKIYGSVYEYHRNDNFDARNFFDPVGQSLPEYKRNQFGVSFGAFVTSKLKVFGSYDGLRVVRGSTILSIVPTPAMKRGDFSAVTWRQLVDPFTGEPFQGNQIPESRIHNVAKNLLSLFPDPNRADPVMNYVNNQPLVENNNSISTRIDYELSPKTKIFGRYFISDGTTRMVSSLPTFGTNANERNQDVSVDLSHSFSSNKVLSLSLSFERNVSKQLSDQAYKDGLLASVGINGVQVLDSMDEGYPQMDILGYASIGFGSGFGGGFPASSPETFHWNGYHIKSDYTYVHGNHNFAIGGTLNLTQLNNMRTWGTRRGQFGYSGQFTGDAFADFLLGIPYTATRGIGSNRADLRQRSWRLYMKDSWKINRNLTLTMGLAYSYAPFFNSTHDNVSFFYPVVFEPPTNGEVVVTGSDRARALGLDLKPGQAAYNDKNDWQPSFAVAYSPFGNNRLVLRASYSIQHSPMNTFQALTYIGRNYPFFYTQSAQSPTRPELDIANPFESAALPALSFKVADPNLRNTYMQDREVSLQYEFLPNWNLDLRYVGRKTTRLFRVIPANVPLPASADQPIQSRRPNPNYGLFEILKSDGSYTNNGLDVRVTRRLTNIFSLQANFLWSRAISDAWSWTFANPNNPRDLSAERALWRFMPMKTFNMNYILDLPVGKGKFLSAQWAGKLAQFFEGWRISGTTSIMGGTPFNPEIFGDLNNDGVWGDRPNRIGPGTLSESERSINKWFETSDFQIPDYSGPNPQWFGNCGRNVLMSPGSTQWDISLMKRTPVTRSGSLLEFRVEFFNAFNNVNFQQPDNFINSPTFGVIFGADHAREIEIALKYSF